MQAGTAMTELQEIYKTVKNPGPRVNYDQWDGMVNQYYGGPNTGARKHKNHQTLPGTIQA